MNKTLWLSFSLFCLSLLGCEAWFDSGFRHQGLYEAKRSGYQMEVIAQGFWNRDSQRIYKSYRLIQICPLAARRGHPLRLSLRYDDSLQASVLFDEIGGAGSSQLWEWRSSEKVLQQILAQAGFQKIDAAELKGMVRVLESGEAILEGQSDQVTVIRATSDSNYAFDYRRPMTEWIQSSELPDCDRQPAR